MTLLSSLLTQNLTAASGVNVCTSPNTATGWFSSASPAAATTTSPSELPLLGAILSGIKFTRTTVGDYDAWRWQMPPALKNMPIPISWYQLVESGFTSGDAKVDVYTYPDATYTNGAKTRKPLRSDASSVTGVPAGTGVFGAGNVVSFDAAAEDYYEMRVTRVAGTKYFVFTNLKIGPGDNGVAPSQCEYETVSTFTIGATTTAPTPGTGAIFLRNTYKDGRWAVVRFEFRQAAGGTSGSGDYLLPLATGLAIDYSRASTAGFQVVSDVGSGTFRSGSTDFDAKGYIANSGAYINKIYVSVTDQATSLSTWSSAFGGLAAATIGLSLTVRVPIVGWDDTVLLGPGTATEFVSHDGTSLVFTDAGSLVPNVAFGTLSTSRTLTFPSSQTSRQEVILQVNYRGNGWQNAADVFPVVYGNNGTISNVYGMQGVWTSTTTYRVDFGNQGTQVASSIASNGQTSWAAEFAAGTRFRALKVNTAAIAGLPFGQQDGSAQLYKAGSNPGYTGGLAIGSGYLGQTVTWTTPPSDQTATTTETDWTNAVLPLPNAGVWLVSASVMGFIQTASAANANASLRVKITDTSNVVVQNMEKTIYCGTLSTITGGVIIGNISFSFVANVASATSYKLRITKSESSTAVVQVYNSATEYAQFYAIRIA